MYRMLKRRRKRAKIRRKLAEHTLKELKAKAKGQERTLKQKRKELKKSEKEIRKLWEENKDEIKLMRTINKNKQKVEQVYDEKQKENMVSAMNELQKEGELPLDVEAKDLNNEVEEAVRTGKRPENSVVDEIKIEEEKDSQEITSNEKEVEKKDHEENQKDDKTLEIENLNRQKQQIEAELESLKYTKSKEVEEYKRDLAKIEAALKNLEEEKSDQKDVLNEKESIDSLESESEKDTFKKELRQSTLFANSSIDRRKIEVLQKNLKNKELKGMTPEEFMTYIGFLEVQKRSNGPATYDEYLRQTKMEEEHEKIDVSSKYAKIATRSLEKMLNGEEKIEEMDVGTELIAKMAEEYNKIDFKEEEQEQQDREAI